jgi:hypothetical protein
VEAGRARRVSRARPFKVKKEEVVEEEDDGEEEVREKALHGEILWAL